eukprot:TRINITY_DN6544_c0_g1_i1.p2 TRINITY_DN6544_c0_g1~~TRINITY_DN6544_c0_g1_i1.p2  ORF type:complete len:276 (+),score=23.21 TRINITY_DN6544_c0_g1_i1:205-1032(+)
MFSRLHFVNDPSGIAAMVMTQVFLFLGQFGIRNLLLEPGSHHRYVVVAIYLTALISHLRTAFTDPGIISKSASRKGRQFTDSTELFCAKCNKPRPPRAHHCSTCKGCVEDLDHHCGWSNTCIGKRNRKYFLLFVLYTLILCLYSGALMIRVPFICPPRHRYHRNHGVPPGPPPVLDDTQKYMCGRWPPTAILAATFLGMESMLFGLFTAIMLVDQIMSIANDQTTIESMKKVTAHSTSGWKSFTRIFGPPSPLWLLPTKPKLRSYVVMQDASLLV